MLMSLATLSSRLPAEVPSFTAMVREKEWRPLLKASWIELNVVLGSGSAPRRLGWPPKLPKPWRRGTNSEIAMTETRFGRNGILHCESVDECGRSCSAWFLRG